jgi:hypothetical protein
MISQLVARADTFHEYNKEKLLIKLEEVLLMN